MNAGVVILGGLLILWLLSKPTVPPPGSPASYTQRPGLGTNVQIPGVGAFATGPAGTSVVVDPRLFGGLFGTTTGAGAFAPGSGVLSPLVPVPPPTGGATGAIAGAPPVDTPMEPSQADGTSVVTPDPAPPPETPQQVPLSIVDTGPITDPGAGADPSVIQDFSVLDPSMLPQAFDSTLSMVF